MDNIIQGSRSTQRNENGVVDNDVDSDDNDDEMDVDHNPSKFTKGKLWLTQLLSTSLINSFYNFHILIIKLCIVFNMSILCINIFLKLEYYTGVFCKSLFVDNFAGKKSKNASNGHAIGDSNNFFADL